MAQGTEQRSLTPWYGKLLSWNMCPESAQVQTSFGGPSEEEGALQVDHPARDLFHGYKEAFRVLSY